MTTTTQAPDDVARDSDAAAKAAGLRFTNLDRPGIAREPQEEGWRYRDPSGKILRDKKQIERINALVIPPAWTNVWINPDPRGHIQVTGRDARGRKQYRYHDKWRAIRDEAKFARLAAFGRALPAIRERVEDDLRKPGFPKEKVEATVVRLLDESLIRIGNEEYARENASFGLTTLQNEHVDVEGATLRFHFRGKSGKEHEVDVKDRRVATIVRKLQDMPGQHLFQYKDEDGELRPVTSDSVNEYLQEVTGETFTAKDFRTWAGTVLACRLLRDTGSAETERERNANIVSAVDAAAARLGNTRAVCRSSYIYPTILERYAEGTWPNPEITPAEPLDIPKLDECECMLLTYLEAEAGEEAAAQQ
jgi:DNA topoisomerase I